MSKNKICQKELQRKLNLQDMWEITYKYSKLLEKNIDKKNLPQLIINAYNSYIQECKSNKYTTKNDVKHNRIWNTLLNTCNNNTSDIKRATHIFIHCININLKNYNSY